MRNLENVYRIFGENLYQARNKRGWTTQELSLKFHSPLFSLARSSITKIETGRQRVLLHQVYRFAEVLNLNICDLLPK